MTSRVIIPFDNNPTSTSIKTASYTVPAGKYALVKPLDYGCTLNGVELAEIKESSSNFSSTTFSGLSDMFLDPLKKHVLDITEVSGSSTLYLSLILAKKCLTAGDRLYTRSINTYTSSASSVVISLAGIYSGAWGATSGSTSGADSTDLLLPYPQIAADILGTGNWTIKLKTYESIGQEMWISSGSVLDGGRFLVTEYNSIS